MGPALRRKRLNSDSSVSTSHYEGSAYSTNEWLADKDEEVSYPSVQWQQPAPCQPNNRKMSSVEGESWLSRAQTAYSPMSSSKLVEVDSWCHNKCDELEHTAFGGQWLNKSLVAGNYENTTAGWLQLASPKQTLTRLTDGDTKETSESLKVIDWLAGEEKMDKPERESVSDKSDDWLLVKRELSRITTSIGRDWLLDSKTTCGTSMMDNRLLMSDS